MSIRTIDFPDHNDPSFDANEPFDAPNGITYNWNGYGWEVSCGFGDPACIMDGETEFLAYAADTDLAKGQAFVDADSIYFKGDQSAFVAIGDKFKAGDDTFTVTAVEVITDATYDEFTKVTVAEDPSGLIGQTLEVEGLCAPVGKRYLLAHGDNVEDADSMASYYWNEGVRLNGANQGESAGYLVLGQPAVAMYSPAGGMTLNSYGYGSFRVTNSGLGLTGQGTVDIKSEDGDVNIIGESQVYLSASKYGNDRAGEIRIGQAAIQATAYSGPITLQSRDYININSYTGTVTITANDKIALTAAAKGRFSSDDALTIKSRLDKVILVAEEGEVVQRAIDATDDPKQITNKEYVDFQDESLRQDIIELEEEINAIAPSLEYGNWEWEQPTSNLRAPAKGTFYLLDASGNLTTEYKDTKIVVINNYEYDDPTDSDPVDIHTWADADPGELIQLFDAADPDFMLGKIVAVNADTENGSSGLLEFVRIEINLIQSSGVPNDNADPVTGLFLSRVNIFKEPSGGTASGFVLKTGDTMTGSLEIDVSENPPVDGIASTLVLQGSRPDLTNSSATIAFQNEQSNLTGAIGYLTYRTDPSSVNTSYFKFSKQLEVPRGIIQALAVRDDATYGVRVERRFTATEDKEGMGFALRGIRATSYDSEDGEGSVDNLFAVYHNKPEAGVSKADSIAYFGKILTDNHITTKGYVSDTFVKKAGDTMTGDLSIDKSANGPAVGGPSGKEATLTLKGDRTGATDAIGTIAFANASHTDKTGFLTYRSDATKGWFKLNAELNISNDGLKTNSISTYSGAITTFNKKLDFTSTSDVNARFAKGFVVKKAGQGIDGSNILTVYNDFVEYDGPTNSDNRIANRKWIWQNTVRDYNTGSNYGHTAGLFVDAKNKGRVIKPGGSTMNKHDYEFVVSATGYSSFFVIGNDACVRNDMYVNSLAENDNPKGRKVATVSSSRSMMSGMRQAILGAANFEDLKSRLLAKLEELENSAEFSEEPTSDEASTSN